MLRRVVEAVSSGGDFDKGEHDVNLAAHQRRRAAVGVGAAFVAGSIASLTGVVESEAGLASGLNNASFQIGAAVGVAILSSVAVSGARGVDPLTALTNGYQSAFGAAIPVAALGAVAAVLLLGKRRQPAAVVEAKPAIA